MSVLRVLGELERIGDLSLRVDKVAAEHHLLVSRPEIFDVLGSMAERSVDRYRTALRAWATMDLGLAVELSEPDTGLDVLQNRLSTELLRLDGHDAGRPAVQASAHEHPAVRPDVEHHGPRREPVRQPVLVAPQDREGDARLGPPRH